VAIFSYLWTSRTCTIYCGKKTLTSSKSPYSLRKWWLQPSYTDLYICIGDYLIFRWLVCVGWWSLLATKVTILSYTSLQCILQREWSRVSR
jgi:hypothetical protein